MVLHRGRIIANFAKNFIKYLFVPVESIISRVMRLSTGNDATYLKYVRPIIGLLCVPIWCFSLIPPISAPKRGRMYYLLVMLCLLYVIGLSAIGSGAGERYRFSVLAFMLPITVWNLQIAGDYLHALIELRSNRRVLRSTAVD
jgi:hypothetical protein